MMPTILRKDSRPPFAPQQQVLVGQQNELAVAAASALPLALAVLEVDAREDAAVEAEGMAFVERRSR